MDSRFAGLGGFAAGLRPSPLLEKSSSLDFSNKGQTPGASILITLSLRPVTLIGINDTHSLAVIWPCPRP